MSFIEKFCVSSGRIVDSYKYLRLALLWVGRAADALLVLIPRTAVIDSIVEAPKVRFAGLVIGKTYRVVVKNVPPIVNLSLSKGYLVQRQPPARIRRILEPNIPVQPCNTGQLHVVILRHDIFIGEECSSR